MTQTTIDKRLMAYEDTMQKLAGPSATLDVLQATPDLVNRLCEVLAECSDDLQSMVDAEYAGMQDKYPTMQRRYQRDIEPVTKARNLIAECRSIQWTNQ
jgi:hypothetical protein